MIVYHGTSAENAEKILRKGFVPAAGIGMSSNPNSTFIFVSESKKVAEHFTINNTRIKEPAIVTANLSGKILEVNKSLHDYEAFGIVSDLLNARPKKSEFEGEYDEHRIILALKKSGYSGFSFKDKPASNKVVYAVSPNMLKPISIEKISKVSRIAAEIIKKELTCQSWAQF